MSQVTVGLLKVKRHVAAWFLPEAGAWTELGVQALYWVITPVKGNRRKPVWAGGALRLTRPG